MVMSADVCFLRAVFQTQPPNLSSPAPTTWLAAFLAWLAHVDLDHLPLGYFQLLRALYQQPARGGVVHPWMGRPKGVCRRSRAMSQLTAHRLLAWLAAPGAQRPTGPCAGPEPDVDVQPSALRLSGTLWHLQSADPAPGYVGTPSCRRHDWSLIWLRVALWPLISS